jgi:MFS family permease
LQPASLAFGKRPVYVASAFITCGLTLWTPFASTYGQWVANRFLLGIFGSPSFSLAEVSISDVVSGGRDVVVSVDTVTERIGASQFFTHERGLPMGIYVFFLYLGATLGPLFGGFIYGGMGWKAVLVSASTT